MISYMDAWKSFDRPARARLIKLYLKIFGIDIMLHLLFGVLFTIQLYLILGKSVEKIGNGEQDH